MSVQFNNIPGNIRVPFFYFEVNSGGTRYQNKARTLVCSQKLASGSASANEAVQLRDQQWGEATGSGSMLHGALLTARENAPFAEIWFMPLDDAPVGAKATGKLVIGTVPLSRPGTASIFIAGQRIRIGVRTDDTPNTIAIALASAINRELFVYLTAAASTNEVTLTAKHKGALGNAIEIDFGDPGEEGPLGKQLVTITAMSGGSGDPEMADGLANLGDEEFDWIGAPYADQANLDAMTDFMSDVSGRWSPLKQLLGHYSTVKADGFAAMSGLGLAQNDQHKTIFAAHKFRSPPWEVAAAVVAKMGKHFQSAPELSRPLHTIKLEGIRGPLAIKDRLNVQERDVHYHDGISGFHFRRDGAVAIDKALTTYQTNEWGDPDATFLKVNTIAQLIFALRVFKTDVSRNHGRQTLLDEAPPGVEGVATPTSVRATILHSYQFLVNELVMENPELFAESLVVERDSQNPNRMNVDVKLDHANQLDILALAATSYMQRERLEVV